MSVTCSTESWTRFSFTKPEHVSLTKAHVWTVPAVQLVRRVHIVLQGKALQQQHVRQLHKWCAFVMVGSGDWSQFWWKHVVDPCTSIHCRMPVPDRSLLIKPDATHKDVAFKPLQGHSWHTKLPHASILLETLTSLSMWILYSSKDACIILNMSQMDRVYDCRSSAQTTMAYQFKTPINPMWKSPEQAIMYFCHLSELTARRTLSIAWQKYLLGSLKRTS